MEMWFYKLAFERLCIEIIPVHAYPLIEEKQN